MDMGEIAANIKEGDIILVWNKNEIFLICTKTYICIYILKSGDMFFPLWEAGGCI